MQNSGFQHEWDGSEERADNSFISHMVEDRYASEVNPEGNHQWNKQTGNEFLALNTDLSIVKSFEFDESTGEVTDTCKTDSRTCSNNPDTESIVSGYVANEISMADDFAAVFHKLLRKGHSDDNISEINAGGRCVYGFGIVALVLSHFLVQ